MIPTLETERLILRAPRATDFDAYARFYESDASRFVGGPQDRIGAWRFLATSAGTWHLRGFGEFAVEEKASGASVGLVGPWFPEGWPEPEIGWMIFPEHQQRGYGFEAAVRAIAFAYRDLGWKAAISLIVDENEPSAALARRLGAVREGEAEFKPYGINPFWRHLPPADFLARHSGKLS
ncbi:GNAT family N-acetyltransferase [Aliihoeflea sp. PC F10.4]